MVLALAAGLAAYSSGFVVVPTKGATRLGKRLVVSPNMTTTAATGGDSTLSSSNTFLRYRHRVFCYGDSLTAGTSGMGEYPYGRHLQAALANNNNDKVQVEWLGLPGWTAHAMVQNQNDAIVGLQARLQAYNNNDDNKKDYLHPVSLVILLAGTNDMGYGFDEEEITNHLVQLHQICATNGVPHTIAVGIPPSGYQTMVSSAADLAQATNQNLRQYGQAHPGATTYTDFFFAYEAGGVHWDADGLHFSPQGYKVLGESLAPIVQRVLTSLEEEEDK